MINICQAINCPYYKSESSSGCQRYQVALHCHLIHPGNGVHNAGFEAATQYALYQENPNVESLKAENEEYLRFDADYLRAKELIENKLLPIQYPNRIL